MKKKIENKEKEFASQIKADQENAESVRGGSDSLTSIEQCWEDEYNVYTGGGKQWSTSFTPNRKKERKYRPNSEDNFIFSAVNTPVSNLTVTTPEVEIEPVGIEDDALAKKLTCLLQFNDVRNKFKKTFKKIVTQFVAYGPALASVQWDSSWMGGKGPDRWIGDIRVKYEDRREIYFDPAIIDLDERFQECSFITKKYRKKLTWIKDKFPDKADQVTEENNTTYGQDEGQSPNQSYVIAYWHRGKPKYMPDKAIEDIKGRIAVEQDTYKKRDLESMIKGEISGIHVAYECNGVLLEYIPYIYEHGLYPFVRRDLYFDENSQYGFGEVRNIKIPQIMHNKADEIEIEAYSRQGLGGYDIEKGALSKSQKVNLERDAHKGGAITEWDNINKMRSRAGVQVPASITNYKEHKQRMVNEVSGNNDIQQGIMSGTRTPFSTVRELGSRGDVKTKQKSEILEDFLVDLNQLRIALIAQFYTEDRYYRLKNKDAETGKVEGKFNASEMSVPWKRIENGETVEENYIPEFDITVKIKAEKPSDREYYNQTAFELFSNQALALKDLWYTMEEGKLPTMKQALKNLEIQNQALAMMKQMEGLGQEQQQQLQQTMQQLAMDTKLDQLPDEQLAMLQQLPPEEQQQALAKIMSESE